MNTEIIREITDHTMSDAGKIIRNGGLVAFPTETVYGLGANAYDDNAVKKIYAAKGRPSDNPLIVHLADVGDIEKAAREVPDAAKKILDRFAPGPFTLILKKQKNISDTVTAGLDTVGVRIPAHETARRFIKAAGVPIAAPSANLSGKPSPTCAEHVINDMEGRIDAIICGGSSEVGVESTIIDVTGEIPTILRPGGITEDDLREICGEVRVDENVLRAVTAETRPKCPGMKYKHYAPDAEVIVVEGAKSECEKKIAELVKAAKENGKRVGVLSAGETDFGEDVHIFAGMDNRELAGKLFGALREFDNQKADVVYAELCMRDKYLLTVKNRLYKSSGNNIIYV